MRRILQILKPETAIALVFLFFFISTAAAQTTATDTVSVEFTETGGVEELALTASSASLEGSEIAQADIPGERSEITITTDTADGGRLHYSVHGKSGDMKITVRTPDSIPENALSVEIADTGSGGSGDQGTPVSGSVYIGNSEKDLITGVSDCYTGTYSSAGPLVRYTLHNDPGFELGSVEIEYTLQLSQ